MQQNFKDNAARNFIYMRPDSVQTLDTDTEFHFCVASLVENDHAGMLHLFSKNPEIIAQIKQLEEGESFTALQIDIHRNSSSIELLNMEPNNTPLVYDISQIKTLGIHPVTIRP